MRENGLKLHLKLKRRFRLDVRNNFFSARAVRQWHRLHREVVQSPAVPGGVEEPCGCGTEGRGQWAWWGWLMIGPSGLRGLFQP